MTRLSIILEKEIDIIHNLGQRTLQREALLNNVSDICGELDRYDPG